MEALYNIPLSQIAELDEQAIQNHIRNLKHKPHG